MRNAQTGSRPPPTHNTPPLFSLGVGAAGNATAAAVAEVAWLCSCPSEAAIAESIISALVAGELVQLLHLPPLLRTLSISGGNCSTGSCCLSGRHSRAGSCKCLIGFTSTPLRLRSAAAATAASPPPLSRRPVRSQRLQQRFRHRKLKQQPPLRGRG